MNVYRQQTRRLIEKLKETDCNTNVILDFFVQLSRIRPIMSIAIINAVQSEMTDSSNLTWNSVTEREWMRRISLDDIRNHVVFIIYKNFQTVLDSEDYFDDSINDTTYHALAGRRTLVVEDIAPWLETCFYIRHVCILREWIEDGFDDLSLLEDNEWDIYPNWVSYHVNHGGLKAAVYKVYELIQPWQQPR